MQLERKSKTEQKWKETELQDRNKSAIKWREKKTWRRNRKSSQSCVECILDDLVGLKLHSNKISWGESQWTSCKFDEASWIHHYVTMQLSLSNQASWMLFNDEHSSGCINRQGYTSMHAETDEGISIRSHTVASLAEILFSTGKEISKSRWSELNFLHIVVDNVRLWLSHSPTRVIWTLTRHWTMTRVLNRQTGAGVALRGAWNGWLPGSLLIIHAGFSQNLKWWWEICECLSH